MAPPDQKKSAQEQKDENLEKQLQQIRDDIVYLRENWLHVIVPKL